MKVLSPGNTKAELAEKTVLYFDVGTHEVWHGSPDSQMTFFVGSLSTPGERSTLCPEFPAMIVLK